MKIQTCNRTMHTWFFSAFSRKKTRVESSPSPRTTPKRAARDLSPADSDGYNSGEDKSERPTGRGQAKVLPQPLLPSPVCPPPSDSREKFFERTHSCSMGNNYWPVYRSDPTLLQCAAKNIRFQKLIMKEETYNLIFFQYS